MKLISFRNETHFELCKKYLRDGTLDFWGGGRRGQIAFLFHRRQIFVSRRWPGGEEGDWKWVRMLVVPFRDKKKTRPSWYVLGSFSLNKIPEISITRTIFKIWLEPLEHIDQGIFIFGIFRFFAFELVLFRGRHQLLPLPHRYDSGSFYINFITVVFKSPVAHPRPVM